MLKIKKELLKKKKEGFFLRECFLLKFINVVNAVYLPSGSENEQIAPSDRLSYDTNETAPPVVPM